MVYSIPMKIAAGAVRAFYLFDVADTIDLAALRTVEGEGVAPADIPLRPHQSNSYLQFPVPPLVARLPDTMLAELQCTVRAKFFDYGVISLRLSFAAGGAWGELEAVAARVRRNEEIAKYAIAVVRRVCDELGAALDDRHEPLIEDYLVIDIERFDPRLDAEALLHDHSEALSNILLGESGSLSQGEIEESLRTRFSYYADDLTIVQWDTAFVYDRRESSDAIQDILEFANSQLLELRTYDALLDRELDSIYATAPGQRSRSLFGRREAELAADVRYLIVDVLELIDRSSNALKVVGDAYYARIYRAAAARLGLADWQRQIDSKLASVRDLYRFFIDQARVQRDEFLEVIVILLIAIEVVIGVVTLVRH
ncbi:MAG TPA: hypothetical protein VMF11_03400 [Candidatus Baltobacteraceae bacterium]|nr:hypothetical protein [Candidatus Baltobacteraceae bacterium]